ncbi:hypothetical protein Ddc_17012 [Ditylenchus destructor]|nr:hypothetical protein Ddc_17012 [Ditylenchus destructor]
MDLKKFDENQIVQSIKSNDLRNYGDDEPGETIKRNYAEFIVKEYEGYAKYEYNRETTIFEFVNNDVGKKMQLILEITYLENYHYETSSNYDIGTCFTLEIINL